MQLQQRHLAVDQGAVHVDLRADRRHPSVEGDFPDTILQLWAGEPSRGLTVIESALMAETSPLTASRTATGVLTGLESLHGLPISAAAL